MLVIDVLQKNKLSPFPQGFRHLAAPKQFPPKVQVLFPLLLLLLYDVFVYMGDKGLLLAVIYLQIEYLFSVLALIFLVFLLFYYFLFFVSSISFSLLLYFSKFAILNVICTL